MAQSTDEHRHPQPESGQGQHIQESGAAGLSSHMEHKFTDIYSDCGIPVEDTASSRVKPIPMEELDGSEHRLMAVKIWSRPVSAEERFLKPSPVAKVQKPFPLPEVPSEIKQEEEADRSLPSPAEEQPHGEEDDTKMKQMKMKTTEKPRVPPLVRAKGRNTNTHGKGAVWKNRKCHYTLLLCLLYLMAFVVPPADSHPVNCFTCKDMERCPKLFNIYDKNDKLVYKQDLNQNFPRCCEISQVPSHGCVVCSGQSGLNIVCSEDIRDVEVEDHDGGQIDHISSVCVEYHACSDASHGRMHSHLLMLLSLVAVLWLCW